MRSSVRYFVLVIFWFALVSFLLTIPGDDLPGTRIFNIDINIPLFDKWIHIILFGIMSILTCLWIYKKGIPATSHRKYFITCGLICLVYGIIMEFVQKYYVAGRSFDAGDIAADAVGSLLGVYYSLWKFRLKAV